MSDGADVDLPKATVARIVKKALPDGVNVGKDAKDAMALAGKVFVHYLTACAADFCAKDERQKLSEKDVMRALKELEFGQFAAEVQAYMDNAEKKPKQDDKEPSA